MLEQFELGLAAIGAVSIVRDIFWLGRWSGKRRPKRRAKPPAKVATVKVVQPMAEVVQFQSREEILQAFLTEVKKGKKGNPTEAQRLADMLKERKA